MQRASAAMVAASALFVLVALAVLAPAAGFAGPGAGLPLRTGAASLNVNLRSAGRQGAVCAKMQMDKEPSAMDLFRKRASSFWRASTLRLRW